MPLLDGQHDQCLMSEKDDTDILKKKERERVAVMMMKLLAVDRVCVMSQEFVMSS